MSVCTGHALIRAYINGHWFFQCVNQGCTYLVQES